MELIQIVFAGEKGGGWNQKVIEGMDSREKSFYR